jgi:PAS domain S-box-containing protein
MISHTWAEMIGKTMDEIWGEEKANFFKTNYKRAIASKNPMTYEVVYDHISPPLIAETTITPIFDAHGICIHLSGISRDITKNKEAELVLKESKVQFESLFELSPYAIYIHDFNKITHVNRAFLDMFEYQDKHEILGKEALETLVDPRDYDTINENRKRLKDGKSYFIPVLRFIKKDGSVFIGESQVSTVIFNGKPHIRISTRDITKSKEAEETLFESEKRYRTLFESSLDGIYKSTPEGKFINVNPAFVEMLGYNSEQELLGIDIKTQLYFAAEDRTIMASHEEDQYSLKKKDGSVLWVEDHSYYEYNDQNEIIYHHGILRDVTAKIEKQKELEILLRVTEEQNGRLQNFAHIVSHNIRSHSSNMTSLVRFMELSQDEYEKSKLFGMLKTSTEKLEDTIQNLSEIITVNQGINKSREQRNLYNEINNVLKVISGDIREKKIAIVIDMSYDIEVNIIPAYLDSILLNVLSNAIKYGSVERKSKVLINAKKQKNIVILSITDNGIGIDLKKNADKIFGMYETFHDNKDARGFGLYITKNQIEAMNGKIEIESEVGKGTTFRIYFNEEN